jgi:uncharacterized membrane protein YhaH (DUF805 family)
MDWYLTVFKKYAEFSGRARRKEYWMFALLNGIAMIVLAVLGMIGKPFYVLYLLYCLGTLIPSISVSFRRIHDTGRSAWWLLIGLIPLIGAIVLLVFFCQDSQPGDNQYGPNPKTGAPVEAMPAV